MRELRFDKAPRAALILAAMLVAAGPARAAEHVTLCSVRSFGGGPSMVETPVKARDIVDMRYAIAMPR